MTRRNATSVVSPARHVRRQRPPRERGERAARRHGGEEDDPQEREAETEGGEEQVLPAGLQRARLAAEADEDRRGGGGRLDEEPRRAEIARERHSGEHGDECGQRGVVPARPVTCAEEAAESPSRGSSATRVRWRAPRGRSRRPSTPPAASTTTQPVTWRSAGWLSATSARAIATPPAMTRPAIAAG